jgi:hypothetical protein
MTLTLSGAIGYAPATVKTIAGDVVIIDTFKHIIAAETGVTDDLETITLNHPDLVASGVTHQPELLIVAQTGHTITLKHNVGNIFLQSLSDFILTAGIILHLYYDGTNWSDGVSTISVAPELSSKDWSRYKTQGSAPAPPPAGTFNHWFEDDGEYFGDSSNRITGPVYGAQTTVEVTIASDAITLTAGQQHYRVDTELDAASDDLSTINGLTTGMSYYLVPENTARTVVIKHGVGNLYTLSGDDITLDSTEKAVEIHSFDGVNAIVMGSTGVEGADPFSQYVYLTPASDARNTIQPSSPTVIPFTVKGAVSQTAPLQRWESSAATLIEIRSDGDIITFPGDTSNTIVGNDVGRPSTGVTNTLFGELAGNAITAGNDNTAIGWEALSAILDGDKNTAVGSDALWQATTANGNTAVGTTALGSVVGGGDNTAIGRNAGGAVVSGTGNVFVGNRAGQAETGSNKLYIHNDGSATPLILGDFTGGVTVQSQGAAAIGLNVQKDAAQTEDVARFGDSGGGNYVAVEPTGAHVFHGTAALPYGHCYGNTIAWTQNNAVQNTWYDVSDTDMADGQLHLVTHDGSGQLTVLRAGRWTADYSASVSADAANIVIQMTFSVNGTEVVSSINRLETLAVSTPLAISGNDILDLAASDTINVSIRTITAGTPTLAIDDLMIRLVHIGGT